jgi:hypothetical protein
LSSKSKIKGTRWESAVRDWMTEAGVPVFRPALHGNVDKGDLFGLEGFTIQCRDTARLDFAGAVDDACKQAANAKTANYFAVVKRRGKGPAHAYAVMPLFKLVELLADRRAESQNLAPPIAQHSQST